MAFSVGDIVDGKVVNITNFGAFVRIDENTEGLVHISEISDSYVEKVSDFFSVGDSVKVKIISDKDGKIALSVKQAKPKTNIPSSSEWATERSEQKNLSFEDKLNRFIKQSNENLQQARTRENKRKNNRNKKQ